MTDAEAFQHIIDVAKQFSNAVTNNFPETTDLKEVMRACAKHLLALSVASKGNELTTATAIVGMALLLNRKDQVDKITLVNATNVKD